MNSVTVAEGQLIIEPRGLNKLWGFRRELRFPLAHVRQATADPRIGYDPPKLRLLGLSLPGKHVGTFSFRGGRGYWNISDRERNVSIELTDESLTHAVLTVNNPTETAQEITDALQRYRPSH
ncbi:hypothetical protein GCM10027591_16730 [Zhihengliuella somnathii]